MNVRLVDIDSKIPNLALMQISAYHKSVGDTVGFDVEFPDKVYVSCIFSKNREQALGAGTFYPDAEIVFGGSGINNDWLPETMWKIKPDYDLYPSEYSLGYTTRGCVRNCPFCIVREKEGTFKKWQHIREFHDPRFKSVVVLDNNVYANKDWFFENTDYVLENKLKFNAIQGMDIRLLTEEIAVRLKELKWHGNLHFAFDDVKLETDVLKGIEILKQVGFKTKNYVQFYVLAGYPTADDAAFDDALYRCNLLKENHVNAFVMKYAPSKKLNALARWANRKWLFWNIPFESYKR